MIAVMILSTALAMYINKTHSPVKTETREAVPLAGFKAPSFSLKDLAGGKTYHINIGMDKPVILNFWASWCPPCRNEAPEFAALYQEYHNDINIYAVNMTHSDQLSDVKAFAKRFHYLFPILLDPKGNVSQAYWVKTVPTTLLISKQGLILDRHTGYISKNELNNDIKKLGIGEQ